MRCSTHTHTSRHWLRLLRESVCLPVSQSIESSSTKVLFFLARAGARTFPRQHLNRLCQLITFWTGTWRGTTHRARAFPRSTRSVVPRLGMKQTCSNYVSLLIYLSLVVFPWKIHFLARGTWSLCAPDAVGCVLGETNIARKVCVSADCTWVSPVFFVAVCFSRNDKVIRKVEALKTIKTRFAMLRDKNRYNLLLFQIFFTSFKYAFCYFKL